MTENGFGRGYLADSIHGSTHGPFIDWRSFLDITLWELPSTALLADGARQLCWSSWR